MQQKMDRQSSKMVGWFEAVVPGRSGHIGRLYEAAAESIGLTVQEMQVLLEGLRSQRVRIEDVEDWCIDYTYANPSLWLISASGQM